MSFLPVLVHVVLQRATFFCGAVSVIVWIYLLWGRGHFWLVQRLMAAVPPVDPAVGLIAVVIPARNEADSIRATITSLLQQTCSDSLRIFVVDDHSTDGTAEIAGHDAVQGSKPDAVTIIPADPLPAGWSGKLWAVQQGVEQAVQLQPCYLLLTDADVHHAPDNVAGLVSMAEEGNYDLVSLMVKLHCQSIAEKLLIPAFVFFFFMLYPPKWIRDPRRDTAAAAGGCMLIRPEALARAGGIGAIRQEIIDDCALAQAVKRSGGTVWLGVTDATLSLRTYRSFGGIERMIARTAFNQLRHSAWLLLCALVGLALTYLVPAALLFSTSRLLVLLGGSAYLLMSSAYLPMVRFYGLNTLWSLTLPCSAAFYMWATLDSAWKYWSGRGGEWKGRSQDVM